MPGTIPRPTNWPQAPFAPDSAVSWPGQINQANTATLAVTATSGRIAVNLNGATQVELYNAGTSDCFITFGDASAVATVPSGSSGNYPVGPGQVKIITLSNDPAFPWTNCAAICATGLTTTLYISPGVGAS